jgi:hypothetical protein
MVTTTKIKVSENINEVVSNVMDLPLGEEALYAEFIWVEKLIKYRINELCDGDLKEPIPPMPEVGKGIHPYFDWLIEHRVDVTERLALSLAMVAHTLPHFLDYLWPSRWHVARLVVNYFCFCFIHRHSFSWSSVVWIYLPANCVDTDVYLGGAFL